MTLRLLDAGHDVVVYNRTASRCAPLVAAGARAAQTPREAALDREIVVSMVRDDAASRSIWLDPQRGALAGMPETAVAIESSTLTVGWTKEFAETVQGTGRSALDAPVAGSRPQAEAGQLVYVVGGESTVVDRVRDVLSSMGGAIHHVGPAGAGMAMKLAINALFGVQVAALGEVLGMLHRAGIDDGQAVKTLGSMAVTSPALQGVGTLMAAGKFAPMFPIDLVAKDFGYVVDAAKSLGGEVPTAGAVRSVYDRAKSEGLGDENIAAIRKLF